MSRIAVVVFAWFFSQLALAQAYPAHPITMVVPFPPGGVADIVGRPLAATMEKSLKQPVVIVNRTGAGGALGMREVARAAPDGYTVLMALSSISIFPVSERVNGKQPAYELKDFAPIALVTADPTVLVVRADSPYKTVKDFVEAAKGTAAAIGQIRAGKMRALAGWGTERLKLLPDLPTFKELGYDVEFYIWSGVFAPAATPAPVVSRLREAVKAAATSEDFRNAMEKVSTPVSYLDAPEFAKYWERDARRLAVAVEKIGKVEEEKK